MAKYLCLAEKRNQAISYAAAFSNHSMKDGYIEASDSSILNNDTVIITWASGHLLELWEPQQYKEEWDKWDLKTLPIIPEQFKYKIQSRSKKQFDIIKKLCMGVDTIILAGDPDREGEVIAQEIVHYIGQQKKATKRLWVNTQEEAELRRGFQNLHDADRYISRYWEGMARQQADWLVGMSSTRLYTLLLNQAGAKGLYSVGRVQTPTLFLVYKRNMEIENFVSKPFWDLYAEIHTNRGNFTAKYKERFLDKEELQKFISSNQLEGKKNATVTDVEKNLKKSAAPKLYNLSALQQRMNKLKKYSPTDTLKIVQSLYLKKYLSYPRTNCKYITEAEFEYLKARLSHYQTLLPFEVAHTSPRKAYVNNKEVLEHYAIIPTKTNVTKQMLDDLPENERVVYMEVLKRTMSMFAPDYEYEETKITVEVEKVPFHKTGKVEVKLGWKSFYQNDVKEKGQSSDEDSDADKLPSVSIGELVFASVFDKEGKTNPADKYTEGTLVKAMETCGKDLENEEERDILKETSGIGTQATRGDIIDKLKKQEYITVVKNHVEITEKGILLCKAVESTPLGSVEMTGKWEMYLKKIGDRTGDSKTFLTSIERFLEFLMTEAPKAIQSDRIKSQTEALNDAEAIGVCPVCKTHKVMDRKTFYGCDGYKSGCRFSLNKKVAGKTISAAAVKQLLEKGKTPLIKGFIGKDKEKFDAHLGLTEEGKVGFLRAAPKKSSLLGTCPVCQKHQVMERTGFYGCTGYKEGCKFAINKTILSKEITPADVKNLLSNKKTDLLEGFISKAGKSFPAYLVLSPENKITFEFEKKKSK